MRQGNDYKALQSLPWLGHAAWGERPYTAYNPHAPVSAISPMKHRLIFSCLLVLFGTADLSLAAPPAQGNEQKPGSERARDLPAGERRSEDARQREDERRLPRLSPEERRALRQQIHEAGHDLYRPKR